jgi:hypothetical protein
MVLFVGEHNMVKSEFGVPVFSGTLYSFNSCLVVLSECYFPVFS